ncbi:MAG: Beta-barrel assembly-enhancing protease [Steroidobacteraceae bacterium]|nr:Beta-barrel assembly-enhancing protease [Steroidobacteraceae bacterium]
MRHGWLAFTLALCAALAACGVNPVTGKKEIQFVSESQELAIGRAQYAPMRQVEGGDFDILPDLTAYVNGVGQKLAAVSDRPLPYEFVVLDNSVPNAWALPGGKIAVNRGLLTELTSEAELAAVLGHEIVHAAARHGAKAQERGTLMQAGMAAAQIGAAVGGMDAGLANLALGGSAIGLQMLQMKYGRDQELESDHYGMKYMKLAGYDPWGAVTLQETFVRLSSGKGAKQQGWLEGLFASHPPSQERLERNRATAAELGRSGTIGADRYAAAMQPLLAMKPGHDKYDEAVAAARRKEFDRAHALALEAARLLPRDGRAQQLLGDIDLARKQPREALGYFRKADALNGDYFGSSLGLGIASYQLGDQAQAASAFERSAKLLPTAPAAYYLGAIARDRGDTAAALRYFKSAAGSDSSYGKEAAEEYLRLDLPQNPGNYVAAGVQTDANGRTWVIIENRAPMPLAAIVVTPVLLDANGRIVQQGAAVQFRGPLPSGQRASAAIGTGNLTAGQLQLLKARVDAARPAP